MVYFDNFVDVQNLIYNEDFLDFRCIVSRSNVDFWRSPLVINIEKETPISSFCLL